MSSVTYNIMNTVPPDFLEFLKTCTMAERHCILRESVKPCTTQEKKELLLSLNNNVDTDVMINDKPLNVNNKPLNVCETPLNVNEIPLNVSVQYIPEMEVFRKIY